MLGVGANQTQLVDIFSDSRQLSNQVTVDMSQAMWRYKNLNLIGTLPVAEQAQNLPLDSIDKIQEVVQLSTTVKTWTGYISPQQQDKDSVLKYNEIQQGLTQGYLSLIDQQKHFCSDKGKLMVVLVYGQMLYKLNPRYKYLKEQLHAR